MDFAELEQRPAKKRRFFVEDSPVHDSTLNPEPSLPGEINAPPESARTDEEQQEQEQEKQLNSDGFDVDILSSFVGEQLPDQTISKLKELSGGDIQRGEYRYCQTAKSSLIGI